MGLRPLLGPPCIPPEAPRLGFPVSVIPRGLRGFCSGSFLAALGDLPARRAMPACGFTLNGSSRTSHFGCRKFQEWQMVVKERHVVTKGLNFGTGL